MTPKRMRIRRKFYKNKLKSLNRRNQIIKKVEKVKGKKMKSQKVMTCSICKMTQLMRNRLESLLGKKEQNRQWKIEKLLPKARKN